MELDTLQALYLEGLRDLYSAENQIMKALPKMQKAASSTEVQEAFATHLAQTEQQIQRLERIFTDLGETPTGKHCKGMEGLIAEGTDLMKEDADPDVMDAGLIASAQHVEHYEMAGYGTVRTYAELLGFDDHMDLLQQTLNEEEETDQILTEIALTSVNLAAMASGEGEEGGESDEASGTASTGGSGSRTAGKTPAKKSMGASRGNTSGSRSTSGGRGKK
ncbi:MAG TPA: ferritin-like domain-containing protein [Gemmatimonas sp.]|nr:ferritin-like domain-containing protein [Gemmatimonas sp.]